MGDCSFGHCLLLLGGDMVIPAGQQPEGGIHALDQLCCQQTQ